jgi:hypothetical protein
VGLRLPPLEHLEPHDHEQQPARGAEGRDLDAEEIEELEPRHGGDREHEPNAESGLERGGVPLA